MGSASIGAVERDKGPGTGGHDQGPIDVGEKHKNTPQYHEGDLVWLEGHNLRTNQPTAKLAA